MIYQICDVTMSISRISHIGGGGGGGSWWDAPHHMIFFNPPPIKTDAPDGALPLT